MAVRTLRAALIVCVLLSAAALGGRLATPHYGPVSLISLYDTRSASPTPHPTFRSSPPCSLSTPCSIVETDPPAVISFPASYDVTETDPPPVRSFPAGYPTP
jgi:hypothetical protein